jgi:predicted  nucleic acid-binding Zn-ribbon protein
MPGEDLDVTVAGLKEQIGRAQSSQARAEAQAEAAYARVQQAVQAIREEFGIAPEEAPATLEQLRADLAAEAGRVREALERAETSE